MPNLRPLLNLGGRIKVSPWAEDRNIVEGTLFGLRRWLDDLSPSIPQILDKGELALRDANVEMVESVRNIAKSTGIKRGDPRLGQVIEASEGRLNPETLDDPAFRLYSWWNSKRDEYASMLGLEPGQRIENYFTHIVDPMNVKQLERVVSGDSLIDTLSGADAERYRRILDMAQRSNIPNNVALQVYADAFTGGPHMKYYDIQRVPRNIWDPYVKERRGFPVYSKHFYDVVEQYMRMANRKTIMEPRLATVRLMAEEFANEHPAVYKEFVSRIHEGYLGRPSLSSQMRSNTLRGIDTLARTVGGMLGKDWELSRQTMDRAFYALYRGIALWDIGLSPSPIKKHFVADMISIYAELGARDTSYGFYHALSLAQESKSLRDFAKMAGNVRMRFPDLEVFENVPTKGLRGVERVAFLPYQLIDIQNQLTAWIGGYARAYRLQDSLPLYRTIKERVLQMTPETAQSPNLLREATAVQYANRVNQFAVPKQSPLDLPGLLRSPLGKLAFQFSAKRMQRGELLWDQLRRAENAVMLRARGEGKTEWSEITPFVRAIVGTAILTGLPFDEMFANKTGLDPSRIPVYDVFGKLGFGMRKVLHNVFPDLGPALQAGADVARVWHDPGRIGNVIDTISNMVGGGRTGRELYTELPALPVAGKKLVNVFHELKTGEQRSGIGGLIGPVSKWRAFARFFGFDPSDVEKEARDFAKANLEFHEKMREIHAELSQAYFRYSIMRNDPAGFGAELNRIQAKHPEIVVTSNMIKGAILNAELPALERLERRLPRAERFQRWKENQLK